MTVLNLGMGWFPQHASGLNRVYYQLNKALLAQGVTTYGLVAADEDPLSVSRGTVQAFASSTAPLWRRWRGVRKATREALQHFTPDVVASHFALYAFPAAPLWKDVPYVTHFHGPWALESQVEGGRPFAVWAKTLLEKRAYRRADHFIVLSRAFRQVLHDVYGVPLELISIGTGGVDCDAYATGYTRSEACRRLGWPTQRPIVLAVRRLAHRMGLENLIHAFQDVVRRCPDAVLFIAGKGPLHAQLDAQIERLGLTHAVRLLGYVPEADLPVAYRAATLSVVPTVALEGFGLITVESLAAGTPPLVTPVGGLPEILEPFAPQLILPGSGVRDLALGLGDALTGGLSLPTDEACQHYARSTYDWSVAATFARSVYQQVIDGRSARVGAT